MKLTQEEKRVKIAETCGWVWHPTAGKAEDYNSQQKAEAILCWSAPGDDFWRTQELPDYFNDLNAIHEARSNLNNDQKERYVGKLCEFSEMGGYDGYDSLEWCIVNSGAADQAEALGLTLNLWEAGE